MTPISLIIAIPDRTVRHRLAEGLAETTVVDVVATTRDLMTTYAEVEERAPMAVLIAGELARQPEFEVMRALFAALDVRWLVISRDPDTGGRSENSPWGSKSDLFAMDMNVTAEGLVTKLRSLTRATRRDTRPAPLHVPRNREPKPERTPPPLPGRSGRFVLIGASTGGVDALMSVLSGFPANCPPTFIVQHTGGGFGDSLTRLLNRQCAAEVRRARDGDVVSDGQIVIAAGSRAHLCLAGGRPMRIVLNPGEPVSGHMPSVDVLFRSAVPGAKRAVAALLTGMGRDGAEGLKALRDAGATTFAQDEATSIVYGMPRAAVAAGAAQKVLPLSEIGPALLRACTAQTQRLAHGVATR